jgi:predicted O-linked N-acetylglucosamine transferase (SPINDLY family)
MINLSSAAFDRAAEQGVALLRAGRVREAGDLFSQILQACPTHLTALRGFADAAVAVGNHTLGAELAKAALEIEPSHVPTMLVLGHALLVMAKATEAIETHARAAALAPQNASAWMGLGLSYLLGAQAEEALAAFEKARGAAPQDAPARSSGLYALHYLAGVSPERLFGAHREWGAAYPRPPAAHANERDPERRLRVGYVSADFRNHAVARFFEPLLTHHDPAQVETFCYYNHHHADGVTAALKKAAGHWREIVKLSDEAAAALIRDDRIDVLVDLSGHTADDRLLVFARRPAPVQVTYLGYPDTTGLPGMDYRITDAVADPPGSSDGRHTERLLRVPVPFVCFGMPRNLPALAGPPAARAGRVTFGSFNTLVKLTGPHIGTWAKVLRAVGGSRLLLKSAALDDPQVQARIRGQFAAQGVAPERLMMRGHMPDNTQHLALYNEVDVALDTFPYTGTTTTCEALAMGVPVVTRAGETHHSRVGASLLTAVGRAEWIAPEEDAYVKIAVELAGDVGRLAELRPRLREELERSPLTDGSGHARHVEAAYREAWRTWCAGVTAGG